MAYPTTANLISWWKFDESSGNAADSHGANTLTNNGTTGFTAGLLGNCADLGTTNSTKYFSNTGTLGLTSSASRSIGVTFKYRTELSGADSSDKLFEIGHTDIDISFNLGYERVSGVNRVWGGRVRVNVADDSVKYNTDLGTAAWHQLVVTWNGTTQILYLDGSPVGNNNPNTGSGSAYQNGVGVGCSADGSSTFMASAYIDETFAFNDVLTADEVSWLWNGGACRTYESLSAGGGLFLFSS